MKNSRKKILIVELGLLSHESLHTLKEANIDAEILNFDNVNEVYPFVYNKILDRLLNIFNRVILNNKNYISTLKSKHDKKFYDDEFNTFFKANTKRYDYILFISLGPYSNKLLKKFRSISNNMSVYFWDALKEDQLLNLIKGSKYFKNIYSFNPEDVQNYPNLQIKQTTNFYFPIKNQIKENKDKITYVGNYSQERIELLNSFITQLNVEYFSKLDISLVSRDGLGFNGKLVNNIRVVNKALSYEDNLIKLSNSFLTLDIKPDWHNGLSFRFFESLYFKNKIITNNVNVIYYDFYHPDNIFITDYLNFEGLNEFLSKPYHDIDKKIVLKYRFDNWLKRILELD